MHLLFSSDGIKQHNSVSHSSILYHVRLNSYDKTSRRDTPGAEKCDFFLKRKQLYGHNIIRNFKE